MPRNSDRQFPKYALHRASGQARVRIDGKDHYLGEYGSPASKALYEHLKQDWHYKRDVTGWTCTIDDLAVKFMEFAAGHYLKHGEPTSEANNIRIALRPLVKLFGRKKVANFEPADLERYIEELISAGVARTSINRQLSRIRLVFKWGVRKGIVTTAVYAGVKVVPGLQYGRTKAVETDPVKPVSEAAVEAVKPFVSRQIWGMIQLQLATGMRPGEVIRVRGCDLNMSGKAWEYTPSTHKTEHHGKKRIIFIGPRGQEIIREFLKADLAAYLFSPSDARAEFDERRKASRKSAISPSQGSRRPKIAPRKRPGERYTVCSYGQAVRNACELAFGMPEDLRKIPASLPESEKSERRARASEWRRRFAWHPHQLRHTAATTLRRAFGIEAARTVLGHASAGITEVYAEMDHDKAREVMAKIG